MDATCRGCGLEQAPHLGEVAEVESTGAIASASVSDSRLVGLLVAVLLTTLGSAALAVNRVRGEAR